jgi:23S rRNA (uracil1939-C5)-methyltransferase
VRASGARRILELGAGGGNLTIPLAFEGGLDVRALELDTGSLVANVARLPENMRRSGHIEPLAASFERAESVAGWVRGRDAIVCDPARGGLGRFIDGLAKLAPSLRPTTIVYVSCHMPALAKDAARLAELGWSVRHVAGVDQFPWTPHAEWIARFERAA